MKVVRNLVLLVLVAVPTAMLAGAVGSLNTFANGAVADAAQMNANFNAVRSAVDDNDARLDALEPVQNIQSVTYQGGWATYSGTTWAPAGYYKDRGRVFLRGLVAGGTNGTCIFTLPAGYRPEFQTLHAVQTNNVVGRIDVRTNGCVFTDGVNPAWVSLDNISFRAP